ncbi:MAG: hypothetical protein FJ144_15590 [Deltaproteobacteria bacterium]|nr:hypothetical protein [Deltaproteobacteria bacterium]
MSPRVPHLVRVVSNESMHTRGNFHTKEEPLCEGGYRRLHVLCGEALCSQASTWLRVGTTALVVCLAEAGVDLSRSVQLGAPLGALREHRRAQAGSCRRHPASLSRGSRATSRRELASRVGGTGVRALARDAGASRGGSGGRRDRARLGDQAGSLPPPLRASRLRVGRAPRMERGGRAPRAVPAAEGARVRGPRSRSSGARHLDTRFEPEREPEEGLPQGGGEAIRRNRARAVRDRHAVRAAR